MFEHAKNRRANHCFDDSFEPEITKNSPEDSKVVIKNVPSMRFEVIVLKTK